MLQYIGEMTYCHAPELTLPSDISSTTFPEMGSFVRSSEGVPYFFLSLPQLLS